MLFHPGHILFNRFGLAPLTPHSNKANGLFASVYGESARTIITLCSQTRLNLDGQLHETSETCMSSTHFDEVKPWVFLADNAKQLPIDPYTQNNFNETSRKDKIGLRGRKKKSLIFKTRVILIEHSPGAYSLSKAPQLPQFSSHWHQSYS